MASARLVGELDIVAEAVLKTHDKNSLGLSDQYAGIFAAQPRSSPKAKNSSYEGQGAHTRRAGEQAHGLFEGLSLVRHFQKSTCSGQLFVPPMSQGPVDGQSCRVSKSKCLNSLNSGQGMTRELLSLCDQSFDKRIHASLHSPYHRAL